MSYRCLATAFSVIAVIATSPVFAAGQSTDSAAPPRTAWGHPDLQGVWDFRTITPLQRPEELADKEFLTAEEAANLEEERIERNRSANAPSAVRTEPLPVGGVGRPGQGYVGSYNNYWLDQGTNTVGSMRTSLIVDPPNGRLPPLTPEAEQRAEARRAYLSEHRADSWDDLTMGDRCLFTTGLPIIPNAYNNNIHVFQTPDQVVMLIEMTHTRRVVLLDGRPHGKIRQWMGESRGHWEGETLVVETKNFGLQKGLDLGAGTPIRGTSPNAQLVERFTRVDADTVQYQFTVKDPETYTRPWTAVVPLSRTQAPMFEYACHEGNYSLPLILSGARAEEKAAAQAAKTGSR